MAEVKWREGSEKRAIIEFSLALALALASLRFSDTLRLRGARQTHRGPRNEPNERTNGKEKVLQYLLTYTHSLPLSLTHSHTLSYTHLSLPFSSGQIPPTRTHARTLPKLTSR